MPPLPPRQAPTLPPRQAPTVPPTSQPVLVPPPPFQEEWDERLGVLTDVSEKRSECWTNWIAFTDPQGVKRAKCLFCGSILKADPNSIGCSSLIRHTKSSKHVSTTSSSHQTSGSLGSTSGSPTLAVACATDMDSNAEVNRTTSEAENEDGYDSENDEDFGLGQLYAVGVFCTVGVLESGDMLLLCFRRVAVTAMLCFKF
ncbi:hypothetical protein LINPERHAP1_LOCUS23332 [Linum perenne]